MTGGNRSKALWLCVTDFRRLCRFEKHLWVGAETPKNASPCELVEEDRLAWLRNLAGPGRFLERKS